MNRDSIPGRGNTRPVAGLIRSPIQLVPGVVYLGIKLPEREANNLPSSRAEVKNE